MLFGGALYSVPITLRSYEYLFRMTARAMFAEHCCEGHDDRSPITHTLVLPPGLEYDRPHVPPNARARSKGTGAGAHRDGFAGADAFVVQGCQ